MLFASGRPAASSWRIQVGCMKHPVLLALAAGLLVLVAAFAAPLWQMWRGPAAALETAATGLPWQARAGDDGTLAVFGLVLGRDTLADAQTLLGDNLTLALVARLGETGVLEALVDPFVAGFVSGRLVLAFAVPTPDLQRWRANAPRSQVMSDGVRRFELLAADREAASRMPLAGLSFVPAVRLSDADVRQRFGPPASTQAVDGGTTVLRYPTIGMAATVGAASRGVLQYVAPRDFEARLGALAASAPGP